MNKKIANLNSSELEKVFKINSKLRNYIKKEIEEFKMEESETDLFETFLILYVNDKISDNEFYVDENYVLYKRVSFL
ncbi:TPA: hypothetical protein ACG3H7_002637 [Clostridioides difficile]